jgi:HEPN domain-containing protein
MLEPDPAQLHVVQQWVQKAEHDLTNAAHTLKLGATGPSDTVCFHAQQCVEKYLKALLAWHSLDFPRTHNLKLLLHLLPEARRPALTVAEQEQLTDYATITRYPGDYEPITLAEARRAVTVARRVRRQIRRWLPKQSLSPRRR